MNFLGVKEILRKSLMRNMSQKSADSVKNDETAGERPKILFNFSKLRNFNSSQNFEEKINATSQPNKTEEFGDD